MNILLISSIAVVLILLLWVFSGGSNENPSESNNLESTDNEVNEINESKSNQDEVSREIFEKTPTKNESQTQSTLPGNTPLDSDFHLPYKSEDVVNDDSPFSIYSKTLENAEKYLERGDFDTAQDLYEGLNNRISDKSIRDKINENLEYIDNYRQVAAKKKSESEKIKQAEQEFPSNEIKLSMSGPESLPDRIQIGITPQSARPDYNLDEIVDKLSSKIEEKQLLTPQNFKQQKELDNYKQALDELRSEVSELNQIKSKLESEREKRITEDINELKELKDSLKQGLHQQNSDQKYNDQIQELQNEILNIKSSKDNNEIDNLKSEIERLKEKRDDFSKKHQTDANISNKENDELKVQITSLQNDLNDLLSDKSKSETLQKELENLLKSQAENIQGDSTEVDSLKNEIENLKNQLQSSISSNENLSSQLKSFDDQINADSQPTQADSTTQSMSAKEETSIQNRMERELEDKDEDFDLLEDYINGPKYNEPTEEDIMEKILNDAAKENQGKDNRSLNNEIEQDDEKEEYEIKGPNEKNEDLSGFDINKLFNEKNPKQEFEEEFYSKFMDRNSKHKKRELPILNVTYNFEKLPDPSTLSREQNVLESSFYKYKPMIEKANELLKRRKVKDAMNYYEVILGQDIPEQFKKMIRQNMNDLTDYLEKYMMN